MEDENSTNGQFPADPRADDEPVDFKRSLKSIVSVRTTIPGNAMTAAHLGTERSGHGVIISDQGLVLTIGYVITEADSVWLIDADEIAVPAHVVGYDQESGFGLVQALGEIAGDPVLLGDSGALTVGQTLYLTGAGGESQCLEVEITSLHEFAGYWEYLLDVAIFTSPVHPSWGGAALLDESGKLVGIGSLILQSVREGDENRSTDDERNMIIPIDLLPPILDDLIETGQRRQPPRPWMGWFIQDTGQGLMVGGLSEDGPADTAGINVGDIILEIDNTPITTLPMLYRYVWNTGSAGVDIQVTLDSATGRKVVVVNSIDRNSRLVGASVH